MVKISLCVLVLSLWMPFADGFAQCSGYTPVAWNSMPLPVNYTYSSGAYIQDPSDENPNGTDIYYNSTDPSSVSLGYHTASTMCFFRMQLAADPKNSNAGGFDNNAYYEVHLANAGGTVLAVVGVDAKTSDDDYVYASNPSGTMFEQVFTYQTIGYDAMNTFQVGSTSNYYLVFQVPLCMISYVSGGAIDANTQVKFYYGTSASNMQSINKDFMACTGNGCSVSFANLSTATLTSIGAGTLPVELRSFSARYRDGVGLLEWRTATESNCHGFEIQRSRDATDFRTISFVEGAGTSSSERTYRHTDTALPSDFSTVTYRLRQIDRDGRTVFSQPVDMVRSQSHAPEAFRVYPNPIGSGLLRGENTATLSFILTTDAFVQLDLFHADGRLADRIIKGRQSAGMHNYLYQADKLPAGLYYCVMTSDIQPPKTVKLAIVQ